MYWRWGSDGTWRTCTLIRRGTPGVMAAVAEFCCGSQPLQLAGLRICHVHCASSCGHMFAVSFFDCVYFIEGETMLNDLATQFLLEHEGVSIKYTCGERHSFTYAGIHQRVCISTDLRPPANALCMYIYYSPRERATGCARLNCRVCLAGGCWK